MVKVDISIKQHKNVVFARLGVISALVMKDVIFTVLIIVQLALPSHKLIAQAADFHLFLLKINVYYKLLIVILAHTLTVHIRPACPALLLVAIHAQVMAHVTKAALLIAQVVLHHQLFANNV